MPSDLIVLLKILDSQFSQILMYEQERGEKIAESEECEQTSLKAAVPINDVYIIRDPMSGPFVVKGSIYCLVYSVSSFTLGFADGFPPPLFTIPSERP